MPWDIISYISTTTIRHGHGAASPPSQGHLLSLHGHGRQETARSGTGVIFSLTQYLAMDAALGLGLFCLWMARPASVLRLSFVSLLFLAASASVLFVHSTLKPNGFRRGPEAPHNDPDIYLRFES
jgi:hypothetical protein